MRHVASFLLLTLSLLAARAAHAQAPGPSPRWVWGGLPAPGGPRPSWYRRFLADPILLTIGSGGQCYDRRLAVNPRLGGDFRLRLWVSARQVIRATPESSVGDTELEECARAAIRTFTLPPQAPEGGATVRFVVRFTPPPAGTVPAAPVIAPPPVIAVAPIAPPQPQIITNPRVTVRIESLRGALAAPSLQSTFPALGFETCATGQTGEIPVNVAINSRGQVAASPGRGTLRDRNVMRCLERTVEALRAPTSSGRTRLRAVFTFVR